MNKILSLFVLTAFSAAADVTPRMFRTTLERGFREVESVPFTSHTGGGARVIDLDAAKPSHPFVGLGVSIPESSCHLLMKMTPERRHETLDGLFGRKGLNLSVARIHMGSSDYSRHLYSYDDVKDDFNLEHFSIDEDRPEVLPVIREIQRINPDMFFFSSPWSPPAWMKDNDSLCGGNLRNDRMDVYTDYFVKFFQAYAREGIRIRAFTMQNEPTANQDWNSPTCIVNPTQEVTAIKMLMPKLKAAGIDARPWLFDQNFVSTGRVESCLADAELRSLIGGVAWHPYAGKPEMIAPLHARYPDVAMYETEMGPHIDKTRRNLVWWGGLVLKSLRFGCGTFVSWCLALDEDGQPNISCGFPCAGLVEIHSETGAVTPSAQHALFRHISPFVRRGASVLDADVVLGKDVTKWSLGQRPMEGLAHAAFRNPDGSHVVVISYDQPEKPFGRAQIQVKCRGLYLPVQVFANSVTTIIIP